ncbi:unnamed protein product [Gordionus sp. m RMFG-2023]|uniref:protein AMN1 homolog n=1 Tax=Gordionus sp. m RMFG-2023 TaxID=3053472 RepID=UPI0030DE63B6
MSIDSFSLLSDSLNVILSNIAIFEDMIDLLPSNLKDKASFLMGKRKLITDANIHCILHPGTHEIDLSQCHITDHSIFKLSLCPLLTYINLECLSNNDGLSNYRINSKSLILLAEMCPNLQDVFLTRCDTVTDAVIQSLAQHCSHLHKINIGGCKLISDRSLDHLSLHAYNLCCIDFSYTLVTNKGVHKLVNGKCKNTLREVSMNGCVNLTDEAVEAFIPFTSSLVILCFQDCPLMTFRSTVALARITSQRSLQYVTFTIY